MVFIYSSNPTLNPPKERFVHVAEQLLENISVKRFEANTFIWSMSYFVADNRPAESKATACIYWPWPWRNIDQAISHPRACESCSQGHNRDHLCIGVHGDTDGEPNTEYENCFWKDVCSN